MTAFDQMFNAAGGAADQLGALFGQSVIPITEAGDQTAITARWRPGETLATWYPDGQVEARRGVLAVRPADWPACALSHRARIDGITYAIAQIGGRQPVLELQLVEYRQTQIAQDAMKVKR